MQLLHNVLTSTILGRYEAAAYILVMECTNIYAAAS